MSSRRIKALLAVDALTPDEAQQVLRRLLNERPDMAEPVLELIAEQAEDVDTEANAESMKFLQAL